MGSFRRLQSGTDHVAVFFSGCCFSSEDEISQELFSIASTHHILGFIKITPYMTFFVLEVIPQFGK